MPWINRKSTLMFVASNTIRYTKGTFVVESEELESS